MRQLKNYLLASLGLVIITVVATVTFTQGVEGKESNEAKYQREHFVLEASCTSEGRYCTTESYTVPTDKIMVIETVAVRAESSLPIENYSFGLFLGSGEFYKEVPLPISLENESIDLGYYTDVHLIRYYIESEGIVLFEFERYPEGDSSLHLAFSGYYLPIDSPTLSP